MLLPSEETPKIERNRLLRENAMAAIANGRGQEPVVSNGTSGSGHRRKSSISSRGKRISSSFEVTGIISKLYNPIHECSTPLIFLFQHIHMVQYLIVVSTNTSTATCQMPSVFVNS